MIIKNIGNKIISIGSNMLMPDSQIKVGVGMKKNPAIAALVEKGYIKIVDEDAGEKASSNEKSPVKDDIVKQPENQPAPEQTAETEQAEEAKDGKREPEEAADAAEAEAPKHVKRNFKRTTTAAPATTPET